MMKKGEVVGLIVIFRGAGAENREAAAGHCIEECAERGAALTPHPSLQLLLHSTRLPSRHGTPSAFGFHPHHQHVPNLTFYPLGGCRWWGGN